MNDQMKYVIVRCEDHAQGVEQTKALLDGAKALHLQQLAQAGAAGLIGNPASRARGRRGPKAPTDRFGLHRALLGVGPSDPEAAAGRCYAASANIQLAPGDIAWCCDFVTQRDGMIIDPTAGHITTKESEVLVQALDEQMGSDAQRWEVGRDSHHVLVVGDGSLAEGDGRAPLASPELLISQAWQRHLPDGLVGDTLRAIIEEASELLEEHPVNRVRVDLGENPANLLWLWGGAPVEPHPASAGWHPATTPRVGRHPAHALEEAAPAGPRPKAVARWRVETRRTFRERTGLSGAMVSTDFLTRGLARTLGMEWKSGPVSLEEGPLHRAMKLLGGLVEEREFVYVHLRIESGDQVERLCAMERIDQLLLKPLTQLLPRLGEWRLLAVIDDRIGGAVPFIAIGTGLPQQPVVSLSPTSLAESPLRFADGPALFSWLTSRG